ncbi:MAG: transporter, partial [Planctomycetales bacterium]
PLHGQEFGGTEEDEIETDRDAFTRSPRIVAPGRVVLEGSYLFLDQDAEYEGHVYPDALARYGVCDWLELRLGWNYEEGKFQQLAPPGAERVEEGLGNYGAKVFLTEAEGWQPDSSLIITGTTPTSGESNDTDFSLEYVVGWRLPSDLELESQVRYFQLAEEEDHFTEWAPSIVLKAPLLGGLAKAHVEYFGLFSDGRGDNYQQHYVGPGIHFLITPDVEIGTRVFWGMGKDSAEFMCLSGVGVRF